MKKIFRQIGENMHVLAIYLWKSAQFNFKGFLFQIYKNEWIGDIRNLGFSILSTSQSTSEVIFMAIEFKSLNFHATSNNFRLNKVEV
jgi:hypothetical protein